MGLKGEEEEEGKRGDRAQGVGWADVKGCL